MSRKSGSIGVVVAVALALFCFSQPAVAQTSTKNLTINGGPGLSGTLGGNVTATVLSQTSDGSVQTGATLNITDLDIQTVSAGGFLNAFPNGTSNNNTASVGISVGTTSIGINLPTTGFSSTLGGSISVTAGDNLANGVVGAIDPGVPGSDGAWDDPNFTGILNNATVNSASATANSPINASANVTGGLNLSINNDVTIPNVVDTTFIDADLRLKQSSTVSINFDPVQNLSLQNLSFSTSTPVGLTNPVSNFVEANHPTGVPQLDLSASGSGLVETVISGTLAANLTGTVVGSIDLAADLSVIGIINFTVDFDNVVDGNLSDPGVSLINLSESISLPGVELPFLFSVLHEPTADVDFDDVTALIQSGTFGLQFPFSLSEEVVLTLPELGFQLQNEVFSVDEGFFARGDVRLNNLEADVVGQIVLDLNADLDLSLDLLASAFQASAINVIPEPSSTTFLAIACCALSGLQSRRRRA